MLHLLGPGVTSTPDYQLRRRLLALELLGKGHRGEQAVARAGVLELELRLFGVHEERRLVHLEGGGGGGGGALNRRHRSLVLGSAVLEYAVVSVQRSAR